MVNYTACDIVLIYSSEVEVYGRERGWAGYNRNYWTSLLHNSSLFDPQPPRYVCDDVSLGTRPGDLFHFPSFHFSLLGMSFHILFTTTPLFWVPFSSSTTLRSLYMYIMRSYIFLKSWITALQNVIKIKST